MRQIKKSKIDASSRETRTEPYQKTRAITKKTMDWDKEYKRLLQMAVLLDLRRGSSKLWL